MSKHEIYKSMKQIIKNEADNLTAYYTPQDAAYRREVLNNLLDSLKRELNNFYVLKEKISESQARIYESWLTNYTIKRHEK